jgi:hypothetical protein
MFQGFESLHIKSVKALTAMDQRDRKEKEASRHINAGFLDQISQCVHVYKGN